MKPKPQRARVPAKPKPIRATLTKYERSPEWVNLHNGAALKRKFIPLPTE